MKIVFVTIGIVLAVYGNETQRCMQNFELYNQCGHNAHLAYQRTMVDDMDDRLPDFKARKTCNFLIDLFEKCAPMLDSHNCNGPDQVQFERMIDEQIERMMGQVETSIKDWDSSKCPPVKAHMDRMKGELMPMAEPMAEPMEAEAEVEAFSETGESYRRSGPCGDSMPRHNVYCEAAQKAIEFVYNYHDIPTIFVSLIDTNNDTEIDFGEIFDFTKIQINNVFSTLDLDNNTKISNEEVISAVTRVNFGVLENLFLELFSLADLNNDGELSTQDFPEETRWNLDMDADGEVSLEELLGHPLILFPCPLQNMYKVVDSNKDGIINMREANYFINFLGKIFNVLDSDSDCFVDLDEAVLVLDQMQLSKDYLLAMELAIRPASALARYLLLTAIEDMDDDNDSQVSIMEMESHNFQDLPNYVFKLQLVDSILGRFPVSGNMTPWRALLSLIGQDGLLHELTHELTPSRFPPKNVLEKQAMATWLSLFQGFLDQPRFNQTRPVCN